MIHAFGRGVSLLALVLLMADKGVLPYPRRPTGDHISEGSHGRRCERIVIPLCAKMKYNMTGTPNLVGQANQKDAAEQLNGYMPLIQFGCSRLLTFFLCSLYAPMCTEQVDETMIIPPCRSLCLEVRDKCEPVLNKFNFAWPPELNCTKLPEKSDRSHLCMDPPGDEIDVDVAGGHIDVHGGIDPSPPRLPGRLANTEDPPKGIIGEGAYSHPGGAIESEHPQEADPGAAGRLHQHQTAVSSPGNSASEAGIVCPPRFTPMDQSSGMLKQNVSVTTSSTSTCAPRCATDVLFRADDKRFMETWMITWSCVSFVSSVLTVLTFLLDTSRFRYPERPIVFIALSSGAYSLAYLLRCASGPDLISCNKTLSSLGHLIQDGLENTWCVIVFLVLYFFGMVSAIWWVVLTITFYLASGQKWGREAIEALTSYFHLAAWGIPAVKTIVILTLRKVDGEELTGLCYVGNQDPTALLAFVIVPLLVYLTVGTAFIVAGFAAMCRIRRELKVCGNAEGGADRGATEDIAPARPRSPKAAAGDLAPTLANSVRQLEKLMAKIGVFVVLYTVPMTCVIVCLVYEFKNTRIWHHTAMNAGCLVRDVGESRGTGDALDGFEGASKTLRQSVYEDAAEVRGQDGRVDCVLAASIPAVDVFVLKVFMFLAAGTASGVWTWSRKTFRTWKDFLSRALDCCCCCNAMGRKAAALKGTSRQLRNLKRSEKPQELLMPQLLSRQNQQQQVRREMHGMRSFKMNEAREARILRQSSLNDKTAAVYCPTADRTIGVQNDSVTMFDDRERLQQQLQQQRYEQQLQLQRRVNDRMYSPVEFLKR